ASRPLTFHRSLVALHEGDGGYEQSQHHEVRKTSAGDLHARTLRRLPAGDLPLRTISAVLPTIAPCPTVVRHMLAVRRRLRKEGDEERPRPALDDAVSVGPGAAAH